MRDEAQPVWKNYNFLERSNAEDFGEPKSNDATSLKKAIDRVKHENKDFAAELDKAQSLLKLQNDIEKENRQFHTQDLIRLKLLSQSEHLKA